MTARNDGRNDSADSSTLPAVAGPDPPAASESTLRQRAEEKARATGDQDLEDLSPEEARRLLHELRVHQIELEIQNEELRRAQEALEASWAQYFDLYDLAPVGYLTVGEPGLILEANLTAATLLGVARGALVKRPLTRFILPEDQDIYYRHRKQLFETGEPQVGEIRMVRQGGSPFWARFEATVAQGTDGAMPVCRITVSDITKPRQAEQQIQEGNRLRELAARLTLAEEQERRRIAVGVHDQIGQHMALVKLALQSLNASTSDPSVHRPLKDVCREIDQVIEDAHSLTFDLSNPVLHETGFVNALESWLVHQIHDRHGLQYTFDADKRAATTDKDTGITLFQIVRELLANVVKHAKAKRVDVRIRKAGDKVQITVQDDGIGFDPSKVGLPDLSAGGYGLFSTRERLEYLGGNLKIESAPGRGTRISIVVPVQSR